MLNVAGSSWDLDEILMRYIFFNLVGYMRIQIPCIDMDFVRLDAILLGDCVKYIFIPHC